jgi:hypothetical protein
MAPPRMLTFCWWNLHNFAHYDPASSSKKRRWKRRSDYEAKKRRFHATFKEVFPGDPRREQHLRRLHSADARRGRPAHAICSQ